VNFKFITYYFDNFTTKSILYFLSLQVINKLNRLIYLEANIL